jgi:Tripartite tricarboxylate transporter TctB family
MIMSFIKGPKDFWAGALFIAIGAFAVIVAINYPMGTAARMGPGYFPRALGSLLMILGAVSVLRSFREAGAPIMRWKFRPIIVALGSTVIFGLMLQYVGLALSTVFLVVASSAASHEFRPLESLIVGVCMAVLCTGVFVYGINIQVPVWPAFS